MGQFEKEKKMKKRFQNLTLKIHTILEQMLPNPKPMTHKPTYIYSFMLQFQMN